MTELVVIRHGPTAWNRAGRIQGRSDQVLDPDGRQLVRRMRLPAAWHGYRWVTSPLRRAHDTAALLGHPDAEVQMALIETDWGRWEGESLADLRDRLGRDMERMENRGLDFRPPGGESPRDLQARLTPWLAEVAAGGQPTVAVCHKGVMRALYALAIDWDMVRDPPTKLNADLAQVFALDSKGRLSPARLNVALLP